MRKNAIKLLFVIAMIFTPVFAGSISGIQYQGFGGDFGQKRPGIPEQKDQTFRCMKTKFSGPKRPTYPHFQALAV